MYLLQKALVVGKDMGSRWSELDVSLLFVSDLFLNYRKVYLILSNPFLPNQVAVDMDTLRSEFSSFTDTVPNLLISLGNRALVALPSIPVLNTKYVTFHDAFRAGYKVEPTNMATAPTATVPATTKTSLRLNRDQPPTDMKLLFDNCLISVNGFFYRTDCDGDYTYVVGANNSLFKSRQNQIGIHSFLDIGGVKQIAITDAMITAQDATGVLKDRAYIHTGLSLTNKTVLLVLNGYLLFAGNPFFWQTSEDSFAIDFKAMPLVERYFEALHYMDFSNLGLPVSSTNKDLINLDEFYSDVVLRKMLTTGQSFLVVVDTPSLFTNKIYIRKSGLPGMFTSYREPTYPLFVGNGRVAEYWKTFEDTHWAVNVQDSYLQNNVFSSSPQATLSVVSNNNLPWKPYVDSNGFLLEIGRDF